ncbi:ATP-binding cassette domain-containing protein [Nonomuraea endophytica]|uniref:ABC-type uncharacterized transport system YnjBCD ATPase subunit n=1 Tax=Nonomuraea endophytica TaxID=714136 RepID=A0A7W8EH15_9ACTN|nr:ATP-binding cassette domain-containing protein [Nonomuraea endophytica]MBB5078986.1 ABC-type uncharacterized transport system YnjBCD ATPase subunit [Nonomuraea endophytica]
MTLTSAPQRASAPKRGSDRVPLVLQMSNADCGPMALREVSFTIEPGHRVAIVGSTAAGKTTLAMILLGLYEPTSGSVVYGVPDADVRLLRAQIGAVLQEPVLFSGSLRDNITMGDADVDEAALATALRVACLDDDVARMPLGLDTRVSERGGGLSGGRRQRLAIARAVARHPPATRRPPHPDRLPPARRPGRRTTPSGRRTVRLPHRRPGRRRVPGESGRAHLEQPARRPHLRRRGPRRRPGHRGDGGRHVTTGSAGRRHSSRQLRRPSLWTARR